MENGGGNARQNEDATGADQTRIEENTNQTSQPKKRSNEHAKKKMDVVVTKKTKAREMKRQKLSIRLPQKGIVIKEPTEEQPKVLTQASQTGSSKGKGKGKLFTVETDPIEEEDEAEMNTQEDAEKEFADDEDEGREKEDDEMREERKKMK